MHQSLRIGFNEDFYPFAYGTRMHCAGMVIDIVKATFANAGLQIQLVPLRIGDVEEQLAKRNLDILAGVAINEQRHKTIRFSQPIVQTGGAWFIASASPARGGSPKRVSTPGTGPLVSIINQQFPDIVVVKTENYCTALEAALSETVDAAALNYHVGCYIAERDFSRRFTLPDQPFCNLPLAMAFNNTVSNALIDEINQSLQIVQNGTFLQRLTALYLRL